MAGNEVEKAAPGGRPGQRRRTRRAIVEAAMELVANGATPSVAEVAAAADVSRRTVYSYFPSLDQLMVDATLGLVSGAETAAVLDELDGEPAERRVEALAREIQAMDPEAERLGRKLIALTIEGEGPGDGTPRRGFRRVEWIERALEPLRERLDDERFERLVSGLALVIGFEALVVERDVRGLTSAEAAETSAWAARALVAAALAD
ncbi:MAG TPA: TetR family transcriptional regulator [Solirubrobacterales bacterium]|nr:TetR family transcriptional regulator [Solirubrobacterales bacterium]